MLTAMVTVAAEGTATAAAMPPVPTPGPIAGPNTLYDPVNRIRINLLPGWYASPPLGGVIQIYSWDVSRINQRPEGSLIIHIGAGPLNGQSLEDWVTRRRQIETTPRDGGHAIALTDSEPYELGRYKGYIYTIRDISGIDIRAIDIGSEDKQFAAAISIKPVNDAAVTEATMKEAISILQTIELAANTLS